jgi:hypothetical protein
MLAIVETATASAASVGEVVAVPTIRPARIVSVPHDRGFAGEHHEIVVARLLLSMRTLEGCRN